ncbi:MULTISPECIES: acyl carrier protein [unclassified Kribbella]|uniref:acyl carrier protein n=1 Tax=unclassified Kribbella TaxID=2644121 RepID=UPI0037B8FB47|nr:acyl carrier protein [Kribbella sp. NBC_00889]
MNSNPPPPGRDEIISWLAGLGERPPGTDRIDSMELAWLVHQVEQRYGVQLDDDQLERMTTVDDAVTVIAEVLTSHV